MVRSSHARGAQASAQLDLFGERVAIAEHVGRLTPAEAERLALQEFHGEPPDGVSDITGGPLCAVEAGRVVRGASIRVLGMQTEDGARCCRACLDAAHAAGLSIPTGLEGRGFGVFVFFNRHESGRGRPCVTCGAFVPGETENERRALRVR